MKTSDTSIKHRQGYGFRIVFAVFLLLATLGCLMPGVLFGVIFANQYGNPASSMYDPAYAMACKIIGERLIGVCVVVALFCVLSFIGAVKGRRVKWGNTLCIVLGSIFCVALVGIFAVVGGIKGNKVIDHPETEEDASRFAGYGLRQAFAVIMLVFSVIAFIPTLLSIFLFDDGSDGSFPIIANSLLCASAVCIVVAILGFIGAKKGRSEKWGNTLSIVLGCIFCPALIGIFAIAGGVKGRAMFKKPEAVIESVEEPDLLGFESVTDVEEAESCEYIQPKISEKGQKAIMIILIVSYALFLIAGILLAALPSASSSISGLGICEKTSARAYGITIGVMWVALVPASGYFLPLYRRSH